MSTVDNNQELYLVVINNEEQYSIWPQHLPLPGGWQSVGSRGIKHECLEYIEAHWTDMRPKSVRGDIANNV